MFSASGHNSKNKEGNKGCVVGGMYADSWNLNGHKGIELLTYNLCKELIVILIEFMGESCPFIDI